MSTPERLIKLDDARPGQILSRPLQDASGQMLMVADVQLTETIMLSLRRRDIEAIWIHDAAAPGPDPAAADAARRAQQRQRLARLFRHDLAQHESPRLLALVCRYRGVELP